MGIHVPDYFIADNPDTWPLGNIWDRDGSVQNFWSRTVVSAGLWWMEVHSCVK